MQRDWEFLQRNIWTGSPDEDHRLISLNEYMDQGSDVSQDYSRHMTARFDGPEESVEKEELTKVLGEALELLTEKEKK